MPLDIGGSRVTINLPGDAAHGLSGTVIAENEDIGAFLVALDNPPSHCTNGHALDCTKGKHSDKNNGWWVFYHQLQLEDSNA